MTLFRIPVLLNSIYVILYVEHAVTESMLRSIPEVWNNLNEIFSIDAFQSHWKMTWKFVKVPSRPATDAVPVMKYMIDVYTGSHEDLSQKECYLIVSQIHAIYGFKEQWKIFYYVGKRTSTDQRQAAADFGMKMYSILTEHSDINVHFNREIIGKETPILREVLDGYFDLKMSQVNNLYLVKGDDTWTRIEKIPKSAGWLNNNNYCLVLEFDRNSLEHPPHVYCPCRTSELEKKTAKKLGVELLSLSYYNNRNPVTYFETENDTCWPTFKERLNSNTRASYTPNLDGILQRAAEIDDSFVRKRDEAVALYKTTGERWEKIDTTPLRTDLMKHNECYVLDSASFGGVYVVVGEETSHLSRTRAIRYAEKVFTEKYDSHTRVTIMKLGRLIVDLKIHIVDWSHNPNVQLNPVTQEYLPNVIQYL